MAVIQLPPTCIYIATWLNVSVYGFWCFSYERYNGILGSFPTNEKNIVSQLMRRFIYESECHSQLHVQRQASDEQFSSIFQHLALQLAPSDTSEIHRHHVIGLQNCYDFLHINLLASFKTSVLSSADCLSAFIPWK